MDARQGPLTSGFDVALTVFDVFLARRVCPGASPPVGGFMWNQVEAFARTLRAIAQGLITVAAFAAWEAGQAALAAHGWQPRTIAIAALTAGITAIVTYVYNLIAPRSEERRVGKKSNNPSRVLY